MIDGMPHNIEAEQALLGALINRPDLIDDLRDVVVGSHFFEPLHGRIFEAACSLINRQIAPSAHALKVYFEGDEALAQVGGPAYLARLASAALTVFDARAHAIQIRDLAARRALIATAQDIIASARSLDPDQSAAALIDDVQGRVSDISAPAGAQDDYLAFAQVTDMAVAASQRAFQSDAPSGLSTGLRALDAVAGRLKGGDMIVLGGATSMGKTALALDIAEGVARAGAKVAIVSMEMAAPDLAIRSISKVAGVPGSMIEDGQMSSSEMMSVIAASHQIEGLPIWIDQGRSQSISTIRARARRQKRRVGLDFLVIDHLGFIRGSRADLKEIERSKESTAGLKALAGELQIPILVLAHLNRESWKRSNPRPQLSDLYGSSAIEQDADVVLLVYREEYYLDRNKPPADAPQAQISDWQAALDRSRGRAEVIVAKGRRRGTGTAHLLFDAHLTRFRDQPEDHVMEAML